MLEGKINSIQVLFIESQVENAYILDHDNCLIIYCFDPVSMSPG